MDILQGLVNNILVPIGIVYFGLVVGTMIFLILGMLSAASPFLGFLIEAGLFYFAVNYVLLPLLDVATPASYLACCGFILFGRFVEKLLFSPKFPKENDQSL